MPLVKNSRYVNKDYCISFGNADVVEVELTLDIRLIPSTKEGTPDKYEIANLNIKPFAEQEFFIFLLDKLPAETCLEVYAMLLDLARKEVTPELFSYFYAGELLPDSQYNATLSETSTQTPDPLSNI